MSDSDTLRPDDPSPSTVGASLGAKTLLREHLTLVLTFVAGAFTAVRVLATANLDPVTALAIIQNVGPGYVLISTFVVVVPLFLAASFAVTIDRLAFGKCRTFIWQTAFWMLGLGCFFLVPWFLLVGAVFWGLLRFASNRMARKIRLRMPQDEDARELTLRRMKTTGRWLERVLSALVGSIVALQLLLIQPWIAPEILTIEGREEVGYVLSQEDRMTVLLTFRDRRIEYIPARPKNRRVCAAPLAVLGETTIAALFMGKDKYTPCPR